eukprot:g1952.t1
MDTSSIAAGLESERAGKRRRVEQEDEHRGVGTIAVHVGQEPNAETGAVTVPISLATTFAQASPGKTCGLSMPESFGHGFEYSRTGNPTRGAYERQMAALEHSRHCCAFSSGMAAVAAIVEGLLEAGDHVVCIDDVYGGTQRYFRRICKPCMNLDFALVDLATELDSAVVPGRTKLVWCETPTNPTLKLTDVRAIAAAVKRHGIPYLVVDNTFMSPYFQNPLDLGANIVMHSVTKYVNGHSDVVGGVVCTNDDATQERLRFVQNSVGAVPSPFDCYLAMRGLKTLHVRMAQHAKNALAVARFLETHPSVERVLYPGLPSHPQHALARRQMHGFGGMVTLYVKGGLPKARAVLESFRLFALAESLGAVESLAESPAIMTHASVPPEQRAKVGITDGLIRLSVGIEGTPDIIADLDAALAAQPSPSGQDAEG